MPSSAGIAANCCAIESIVESDGTQACGFAVKLAAPDAATRDLADAIHALSQVHGSAPSIIALAAQSQAAGLATPWLATMADAFDHERMTLISLAAAVGPVPSTPRHGEAQAAIAAQRHALITLAQSARAGCATGAALALLLDWRAIRPILDLAAERCGTALSPTELPDRVEIINFAQMVATTPSHARALAFGAQQLALQHHGLWQLLASRAEARAAL